MSAAKLDALTTIGPAWLVEMSDRRSAFDPAAAFGRTGAPRTLDVGFGTGESTISFAREHPDHDVLAVDVHLSGIAQLLRAVDVNGLTNVRVVEADVWEVLHRLESASLERVHVFFPDPWPKARHRKRRLMQAPFVSAVADRLKRDGVLHVATDWPDYADSARDVLAAEPAFTMLEDRTVCAAGPEPLHTARCGERPATIYEQRGLAAGRPVIDLVAQRCG